MDLEKLNEHIRILRKLEDLKQLQTSLRAAAEPGAQRITGLPHAPGYEDRLGDLTAEIADVSDEIAEIERESDRQEEEITAFIRTFRDAVMK